MWKQRASVEGSGIRLTSWDYIMMKHVRKRRIGSMSSAARFLPSTVSLLAFSYPKYWMKYLIIFQVHLTHSFNQIRWGSQLLRKSLRQHDTKKNGSISLGSHTDNLNLSLPIWQTPGPCPVEPYWGCETCRKVVDYFHPLEKTVQADLFTSLRLAHASSLVQTVVPECKGDLLPGYWEPSSSNCLVPMPCVQTMGRYPEKSTKVI